MRKIMRIKREVTRKYTRPGDTRDRQDRLWLCIHVEDEENQQYRLEPVFAYCLKDGKKLELLCRPSTLRGASWLKRDFTPESIEFFLANAREAGLHCVNAAEADSRNPTDIFEEHSVRVNG